MSKTADKSGCLMNTAGRSAGDGGRCLRQLSGKCLATPKQLQGWAMLLAQRRWQYHVCMVLALAP